MSFRSSINVDEAGIDAGGAKLEAGIPDWAKESLSVEFRNDELRYEHPQRYASIEPY